MTETPDARHFRLAMQSFIGRDKIHNQTTLSVTSGVSRSLINEIIHCKRFAGRMAQEKIARACGLSLADFLALGQKLDMEPGAKESSTPSAPHAAPNCDDVDFFEQLPQNRQNRQNHHFPAAPARQLLSKHPIPMMGLVECNVTGWFDAMDIAISSSVLSIGPKAFAVMAEGESMRPEGISRGMLCYCDPEEEPLKGDAVYVATTGPGGKAMATIKVFWGWGREAGTGEGWLKLRGWRKMDKFDRQSDYFIEIPTANITLLATVVLVRRRL